MPQLATAACLAGTAVAVVAFGFGSFLVWLGRGRG